MVYTEFISADGLIRDGGKSIAKLDIYDNERPVGIQIYGNDVSLLWWRPPYVQRPPHRS